MAKAIAKWKGGIHSLVEAALRGDGVLFNRYQNKTPYGYRWSAWKEAGKIDINAIPETIPSGFATLRKPGMYNDFSARLPN